jgi:hypothetical protein
MIDNPESKPETFTLFKDEKSADAPKTMLPRQFVLPTEAYQMLTNPDFLDLCLKNEYETEELGKALAHVQYDDRVLSKKLCLHLLKGIATSDHNKVSGYLDVVEEIVQVQEKKAG